MSVRWFYRAILDRLQPPCFAKYRPAARVGTRRVERRLLRRLNWTLAESVR